MQEQSFIYDGGRRFSNVDQLLALREEIYDGQKNRDCVNDAKLKILVRYPNTTNHRLIICAKITGVCMNVRGTMVTGTVLVATEFCDLLCTCYYSTPSPPKLQSKCDSCVTSLNVRHTLRYRKVGLVIARQNKVCDKILYLNRRAFPSAAVRNKTLIHQGCSRSERDIRQDSGRLETWGDIIIQGLWVRYTDTIINVNLGDAEANTYIFEPMVSLLAWWEKIKKDKNGKHCHKHQKNFSVCSIFWWNGSEGSSVCTRKFEMTYGRKNVWTHFAHVRLD